MIWKKYKKRIVGIGVLAVLLIAGITAIFWNSRGKQYQLDDSAKDGQPTLTGEEGLNKLQEQADKGNFRFRIHVDPQFPSGAEEGTLMIENPEDNPYQTSVSIYLDENDKKVYQSDVLKPGEKKVYDKLQQKLKKGEYPATAYFEVINPETKESIGKVAAEITLHILS